MGRPKNEKSKPRRGWVYTLNNYTPEEEEHLQKIKCRYHVYGHEKVSTPHLQGYLEFKDAKTFSATKKILGKRVSFEYRKGTPYQAATYCKKDGVMIFEQGTIPKQGKRTDLEDVYEMAKTNVEDTEISDYAPGLYMRYYKAIDRVKLNFLCKDRSFTKMNVYYIYGAAGIGKSKQAHDADPNLFELTDYRWWNGYTGQKTILIDDFNGEIPYGYLLRLLDGYKFHLPTKGGFTWKMYSEVYITSNQPLCSFFSDAQMPAIKRRIKHIKCA